ncbi:hypothetical protein EDB86DRAFT_2833090 [Lactarius hatsudake]|nr:hypothetical protein EDB86DRAFT_2833090 [Lactarius hatsudake]
MPAIRMRSLAPASLCLAHDTLAITLSLSYPHSDVPIHPFVRGCGRPVRRELRRRPSPLCAWAAGGWTGMACVEGWARRPSSHECGWGAWGWAGVAHAKEGWAVRAVPPLVCMDGVGLDAPSVLLRTRAGRGVWGWAGMARTKGWAHLPSSCVCRQGRAGRDVWGWAGDTCAEGDWGGCWEGRGRGAVGPCERSGPDTGEWPARPLCACEGAVAVNAGDRVVARDAGEGEEVDKGGGRRGGVLVPWTLWRKQVVPAKSVYVAQCHGLTLPHPHYPVLGLYSSRPPHPPICGCKTADTPPLPLYRAPPFVRRKRCTMIRGAQAIPPCLDHHVRAGPPPPGPSLPNICPIRVERVRMRARHPSPSLPVMVLPARCGTRLGSQLSNTENAEVICWEGVTRVVMTDRSWLRSTTHSGKGKVAVVGQTPRAH